jgi:hypothetical protein
MLDSGATGNFMTQRIASEQGYQLRRKTEPYELMVVDGELISTNDGKVT